VKVPNRTFRDNPTNGSRVGQCGRAEGRGIGSFLHLFHESAKIRENFKGMSTETDTAEEQHLIRPYPANVENMVS